jgi:hypothetical protein
MPGEEPMRPTAQKGMILLIAVLTGTTGLAFVSAGSPASVPGIEFTADGKLKLPTGYRNWVYVGAAVTPNDLNGGRALFPEFHSVYIDPESFAQYAKTGKYRDGTVVIKELATVGSKVEPSGKGYFMGGFNSLEVAIKDSHRFKSEPGWWGYFSFEYKPSIQKKAAPHATLECNQCHHASAEEDFVFSQDYPVVRAAKPKTK